MLKLLKIILFCCILQINSYASKIVSAGGSITETIIALGHQKELVGVDLSSIYPKRITSKLPSIGYWLSLPQEGIISLKPEIAIISSKARPKSIVEKLPKFGIKTYIVDDKPSINSAKKKIRQIAKILKENNKAENIIKRIEKNVSQVNNEIKNKKKPKVLFLFSSVGGTMLAAGQKTKAGVMITLAGGENVIKFNQYTKISSESILKMNPDIIIKSNHSKINTFNKNAIKSTNAGTHNQIYFMDMLLISGFTVRIDTALKDLSCMFNKNKLTFCK